MSFKNILKKPIIWLPTIIASAILGPIATCLVKTECFGSSAGNVEARDDVVDMMFD